MTHNGKIARLPQILREQLNQKLDNGEQGGPILEWLNALPEVQAILKAEFDGRPINAQNLTNWRGGGYQDWQRQQERRATVRQFTEDAKQLDADAGGVELANHLSTVWVAELAAFARDLMPTITDPAERCAKVEEFLRTLTRVQRQYYFAGRLQIERERRARERVKEKRKDDYREECARDSEPFTRQIKRIIMTDSFAQPDFASQAIATHEAESLLRGVKLDASDPARSAAPGNPQSN